MKVLEAYHKNYKILLIIPFVLLALAIVQIGAQYATTGDFVNKGVTLKGGSTITIPHTTATGLEANLQQQFPQAAISLRTLGSTGNEVGTIIESNLQDREEVDKLIAAIEKQTTIPRADMGIEVMGSSLGESFFKQTFTALIIAFILMGIVVLIYFRTFVPSVAVMLAAFSDIVVTLAIFNLTGIKLETAGIAAFLMLIGYSVDTDILLSTRVLKREEHTVEHRITKAMKTGLMMSGTTIVAIGVSLVFVQSEVVKQIMLILLIGLVIDLVMTWFQNAGILKLYMEKKKA